MQKFIRHLTISENGLENLHVKFNTSLKLRDILLHNTLGKDKVRNYTISIVTLLCSETDLDSSSKTDYDLESIFDHRFWKTAKNAWYVTPYTFQNSEEKQVGNKFKTFLTFSNENTQMTVECDKVKFAK